MKTGIAIAMSILAAAPLLAQDAARSAQRRPAPRGCIAWFRPGGAIWASEWRISTPSAPKPSS